jgi:hypothetical protein
VPGSDLSARGFCELSVMMLAREEAKTAALFVFTLCLGIPSLDIQGWPVARLAAFVSWMDLIGGWDRAYLQEFTADLVRKLEENGQTDFRQTEEGIPSSESMANYSASDRSLVDGEGVSYTSKLNLANFRLAIVNNQLRAAEYNEIENMKTWRQEI